jgi:hypothetical protein
MLWCEHGQLSIATAVELSAATCKATVCTACIVCQVLPPPLPLLLLQALLNVACRSLLHQSKPQSAPDAAMECFIALCHCRCCCYCRRYYLEIVGRRRIKITSTRDLDGYRVASAELLKDAAPAAAAAAGSSSAAAPADAPAGDPAAAAAADATDTVSNTVSNNNDSDSLPELVESVVGAADGLLERVRSVLASRRVGPGQIRELFDR